MLRLAGAPLEQRPGRASQRGGPKGPQSQDLQEEAGGLRQGLLQDNINTSVEEQVAMFLHVVGH